MANETVIDRINRTLGDASRALRFYESTEDYCRNVREASKMMKSLTPSAGQIKENFLDASKELKAEEGGDGSVLAPIAGALPAYR